MQCLYELCGITIHQGSVGGGHYFSYARARDAGTNSSVSAGVDMESLKAAVSNKKWCEFNDDSVTAWDLKNNLERDCFGGTVSGTRRYGSQQQSYKFQSSQNAYMLFYRRVGSSDSGAVNVASSEGGIRGGGRLPSQLRSPSHNARSATAGDIARSQSLIPSSMFKEIVGENRVSQKKNALVNLEYFKFVDKLLRVGAPPRDEDTLSSSFLSAKFAILFVLGALIHAGKEISRSMMSSDA